jgi:nicotinate-nucleotide pyrophosphorylase (carboxylating)
MCDEQTIVARLIELALLEDHVQGDITTDSLAAFDREAEADVLAKAVGVVSGLDVFCRVFAAVDGALRIERHKRDGDSVGPGDLIARISGSESSILRGERTALNFLQRLSGVATLTRRFVERMAGTRATLLDTRKTTPGMRALEKKAVRDGGAQNHRMHLADMALIKDNHIAMAGSITAAVTAVRSAHPDRPIEVEVKNLRELREALAAGCDWIMLDNFGTDQIGAAVTLNAGRAKLEISGNVTLDNIAAKARSGVDHVSSGSLTHSFQSLDITLLIKESR